MLHGTVGWGVSLHLHVSILSSTRFFFYANLSFSYAVPFFFLCSMAQVGRGGLPPSPCLHPVVDTFLFYANLSFSYAVPFFFLCSMAQLDGGSPSISMSPSCRRHVSFFMLTCPFLMLSPSFSYAPRRGWDRHPCTRPDRFWCYPLCVYAAFVLFLCSMGHFPSISMSLPPSPCLHPVVDVFVFLCPRVFLLCVRFLLLCHRCFFANLSFSCAAPSSSYAPRRGWDGGRGTLSQDPTFFGAILYAELAFFMLRLSFSYAPWGAFHPAPCLSLHLHVSHPVVDMFVFGLRTLPFFMLLLSFLCSMGQGMGKGRAWGSLAGPGLVSWPLREPDPFFMPSPLYPPSLRLKGDGTTSSTTTSTTISTSTSNSTSTSTSPSTSTSTRTTHQHRQQHQHQQQHHQH